MDRVGRVFLGKIRKNANGKNPMEKNLGKNGNILGNGIRKEKMTES